MGLYCVWFLLYSFALLDPWVPGMNDLMTTMNLATVWATSLLIVLLHLLLLLSASSPPRVCCLSFSLSLFQGFLYHSMFNISISNSISLFFFFVWWFHQGMFFEDKTRLGSTPPSCHNKCNECHPCMAVQVPSMPGRASRLDSPSALPMRFFDSSSQGNRYSFYKPLGWKCRCGNHFFNP